MWRRREREPEVAAVAKDGGGSRRRRERGPRRRRDRGPRRRERGPEAAAVARTPCPRRSGDIERVDPKQLLHQLPLRPPDVKRASAALAADDSYLFDDAVISPEQARKLITYAKYRMPSAASGAAATEVDSVDGAPAYSRGADFFRRRVAATQRLQTRRVRGDESRRRRRGARRG